jgi:hypothetical protein
MGFLATGYSREGDVLGPVEPVLLEIKPSPGGYILELTFEIWNRGDHKYTIDTLTIHVADVLRHMEVGETLWPGDRLSVNYRMTGRFDHLEDPPPRKRRGWIRR